MKKLFLFCFFLFPLASLAQDRDSSEVKRALRFYRQAGNTEQAASAEKVAEAYLKLEDYSQSILYYRMARIGYLNQQDTAAAKQVIQQMALAYVGTRMTNKRLSITAEGKTTRSAIYSIIKLDTGSSGFWIGAGVNDGVVRQIEGSLHWVNHVHKEGFLKIGDCKVERVNNNTAYVSYTLTGSKRPAAGDVVDIPIQLTKLTTPSIIRDLALLGITCKNRKKINLYDLRQLSLEEDPLLNKHLLEIMAEDIRLTAVEYEEFLRENESFMTPRKAGRFEGLNLLQVMKRANAEDVLAFLRFVKNYPGKYIGKDWLINEIFATWVINDAPPSKDEFIADLTKATSRTDFIRIARKYQKQIREDEFLTYASIAASDWASVGEHQSAVQIENQLIRFTEITMDTAQLAWAIFGLARVYDIQDLEDSALYYYKQAIPYFRQVQDRKGEAFCTGNIGNIIFVRQDYKESRKLLRHALELKQAAVAQDSSDENLIASFANSYAALAAVDKKLGQFDSAIYYYRQAALVYGADGSIDGRKDRALAYSNLAKIYVKQAQLSKALDLYVEQAAVLQGLGDLPGLASLQNDIAYTYYQLGDYQTAISYYNTAYRSYLDQQNWNKAGFSLSSMGQMQWNLSNLDSAIALHNEAIRLRKKANNEIGMAYSFRKLGNLYADIGKPQKALSYFQLAQKIYETERDQEELAGVSTEIASLHKEQGNGVLAKRQYQKALVSYQALGMKQERAEVLESLGILAYEEKKYEESRQYHLTSLSLRKAIGDLSGQLYAQSNLALIDLYRDHESAKAAARMDTALDLAKKIQSTYMQAYCYSLYASVSTGSGNTALADAYNDSALQYYKKAEDIPGQCNTFLGLAYNQENRGDFELAKTNILKSYFLAKENKQQVAEAAALTALGNHYSMIGNFDSAKFAITQSLNQSRASENQWGIANGLLSLGNHYHYLGEYRQALTCYTQCDSVYKLLDWESSRATVWNNVGSIYYLEANYGAALKAFKEALSLLERNELTLDLTGVIWGNIGAVYEKQGFYAEATSWLQKADSFAIAIDDKRTSLSSKAYLAKIAMQEKKYVAAEEGLQGVLKAYRTMGDRLAEAGVLTELGKLAQLRGQHKNQKHFASLSGQIYAELRIEKDQWENEKLLGQYFIVERESDSAIAHFKQAVQILETAKTKPPEGAANKKGYHEANDKFLVYELLVEQLVKAEKVEEAFVYQEKANHAGLQERTRGERGARELENKVAHAMELKVEGVYKQLLKEKQKPKEEQRPETIKALEEKLRVNEYDYRNYLDSLMSADPNNLLQFSSSINPRELNQAREDLPDEMALVEFLVSENQTIIFVATYEKLEARVIPVKREEMEKFVQNFYKQITGKHDLQEVKNSASQLYDVLIAPIESLIEGKSQLALVPTGVLYKLPIHALLKRTESSEKYLLEDYDVFYVNNLRYIRPGRKRRGPLNVLAFGNADQTLPNAEVEVQEIKKLMDSTTVYLQGEAKENLAKELMGNYSIVHFATHGNLDPISFKNSFLTLAPNASKQEDGKLTIEEIRRINLRSCKLIILSACNTAVNDDKVEGWINNPAQEFLLNGAKAVVASLWMVDDAATSQLMISFYTELKGGSGNVQSIRKAQIKLLRTKEFEHPYYWSAFELIGAYQ